MDQSGPTNHGSARNRQQSQPYGNSSQAAAIPSSSTADKNDMDDSGHDDHAEEADTGDQNPEDQLLVDVDVDAMMIGDLDDLNYYDQRGGDELLDKEDIPDDGTGVTADGRYWQEPLSLLLRALALEGLP